MDITENLQYSFPILDNHTIIQCLSEVGIDLSEAELKEPNRHKEKVKSVFASLLQLTQGLDEEYFTTLSPSLMHKRQALPYPDLHDESLSNLKFLRACQKFMRVCIIHDFGIHDLAAATPKRFKRQLSAAINFVKFREERLSIYDDANVGREELLRGLFQAKEERARQMEKLNLAQQHADQRWEEAKVVEDDCSELEIEIAQQNQLQKSIRQESENLKKKANMLKDEIATADLAMQEMEAEERKLLPHVVESPDGLKLQITELSASLDQEREYLQVAEQEAKLADVRVKNVKLAQDDVVAATKLLRDMESETLRYEKLVKETSDIQAKIDAQKEKAGRLEKLREQYEREIRETEEKTEENRTQAKANMDAAQTALQVANTELQMVEKDRRDANATLERHEQEVKLIKSIIEEEKVKTNEEIKEIIVTYRLVEKAVLEKQEEFDAKIRVCMEQDCC